MKQVDIMEAVVNAIEEKIFKEWKHEGFICGWSSEHINFEVDDKEYVLRIDEVQEGEHWCEKLGNNVKCKECEHFVPLFECEGECKEYEGECKNGFYIVSPYGSCGKGKRKGGEEE